MKLLVFPKMLTVILFWHCSSNTHIPCFQEISFINYGGTTDKNRKSERNIMQRCNICIKSIEFFYVTLYCSLFNFFSIWGNFQVNCQWLRIWEYILISQAHTIYSYLRCALSFASTGTIIALRAGVYTRQPSMWQRQQGPLWSCWVHLS